MSNHLILTGGVFRHGYHWTSLLDMAVALDVHVSTLSNVIVDAKRDVGETHCRYLSRAYPHRVRRVMHYSDAVVQYVFARFGRTWQRDEHACSREVAILSSDVAQGSVGDQPVTCTIGPVRLYGVRIVDGDAWLTQAEIGTLFGVHRKTVSEHVCGILSDGEAKAGSVVRNFRLTAADGKSYDTSYYNTDMVLAVGYRVRSSRGVEFRQWVTRVVKGEVEAPAAEPKPGLMRAPSSADALAALKMIETHLQNQDTRLRNLEARVDESRVDKAYIQLLTGRVESLSAKQLPATAYESLVEAAVADRFDTLEARLAKLEAPKTGDLFPRSVLPPITLCRPKRGDFHGWFTRQCAMRGVRNRPDDHAIAKMLSRTYAQLKAEYDCDVYALRGNKGKALHLVAVEAGFEDELFECAETVFKGLDKAVAAE
jgi:hypothetical protein